MNRPTIALALLCCSLFMPLAFNQEPQAERTEQEKAKTREEAMKSVSNTGGLLCLIGVILAINCLPILIALVRGHPDGIAIFLLTVFLGWTCIGWFIALLWAVKSFPRDREGRARDY